MKIAIAQMCASDDPAENLDHLISIMHQAQGAEILFTPEVTNCVSLDRSHQNEVLHHSYGNLFLDRVRKHAQKLGIFVHLGSLSIKTDDEKGRFANRSFLIDADGEIAATYDKIHMFDVTVSETERYEESKGFRPGSYAVVADVPGAKLGFSICYDVRFPHLYRDLTKLGAGILAVPSAFSVPTGRAHWEVLLRARAIETGCFVIAAAQSGTHIPSKRKTYGHSMVVDPWGQVLFDAGTEIGVHILDIDLSAIDKARARVPSIKHDRPYQTAQTHLDEQSN